MKRLLLLALLLVMVGGYLAFDLGQWLHLATLQHHQKELQGWVDAHFIQAALAYFLLYVASTALSLPGATLLTLAGSALFGVAWGLLLVSFASTLGACLAFLCARFLLRGWVARRFAKPLAAIDKGLDAQGVHYLLTLRLVPLFPFFLVNLLMGLTRMPLRTYAWVSQLGMLPATLVYVLAGRELAALASTGQVLTPGLIGALCLLGALPWLGRALARRLTALRLARRWGKPRRFDYNLLVIGAGAGGLVTSYIGAQAKARVALIEAAQMGGDCLHHGCVPSKALLRSARVGLELRRVAELGFRADAQCNFAAVMERVQQVISQVAPHDSLERYRALGVECIQGRARLTSPWQVEVGTQRLSARRIVIATGARPRVPAIAGLDKVDYLTSDTLWSLRQPPAHLLILGGGAAGCELAQAFALLGVPVTLIEQAERLLPCEEPDASTLLAEQLGHCGVTLMLGAECLAATQEETGITLTLRQGERRHTITGDRLLLTLGRQPNVEGLGLEALGVALTEQGFIQVDETLTTSLPSVLAVGDVAGPYQLTHAAAHQGSYAALNALFGDLYPLRIDYRAIPHAIYTEPQLARVGLTTMEAAARGVPFERTRFAFAELDRALCDGEPHGFVEVLTVPGSDRLLGATLIGAEAAERIVPFTLALQHGLGLNQILATVHPYPTRMEGNRQVAGLWRRTHTSARLLTLAGRFHRWRRGAPSHPEA